MQVLHIRNLPYEATHEELEELAQPFGHVTQSKLSVGPNRNQAFIQFNDQSTAVRMVTHFASASEPAKVPPHNPQNLNEALAKSPYCRAQQSSLFRFR